VSEVAAAFQTEGEHWLPVGSLTMDCVANVLSASAEAPLPGTGIVDLSRIEAVDSAGVALLLAWKRRAATEGKPMTFSHIPPSLASLAQLYGVGDLLVGDAI
jgi:phospholipid transport system transporter-binding protein